MWSTRFRKPLAPIASGTGRSSFPPSSKSSEFAPVRPGPKPSDCKDMLGRTRRAGLPPGGPALPSLPTLLVRRVEHTVTEMAFAPPEAPLQRAILGDSMSDCVCLPTSSLVCQRLMPSAPRTRVDPPHALGGLHLPSRTVVVLGCAFSHLQSFLPTKTGADAEQRPHIEIYRARGRDNRAAAAETTNGLTRRPFGRIIGTSVRTDSACSRTCKRETT